MQNDALMHLEGLKGYYYKMPQNNTWNESSASPYYDVLYYFFCNELYSNYGIFNFLNLLDVFSNVTTK